MTYFQVTPGQVVGSAHMNAAISQGVPPFATASARNTAIPAPVEGQMCYIAADKRFEFWTGTKWAVHSGTVPYGLGFNSLTTPAGWARASLANTDLKGGMVKTADGFGLKVPVDGLYTLTVRASTDTSLSGIAIIGYNQTPNVAVAPANTALYLGRMNVSGAAWVMEGSVHARLAAGDEVSGWFYTSVASTIGTAAVTLMFESP